MSKLASPARGLAALMGFVALSAVVGVFVAVTMTPALAVSGLAANRGIAAFDGIPDYLKIDQLSQTSTMYAMKGGQEVPLATFYAQNRDEVGWSDISQSLKDAAVATEDPRFYEEGGVDLMGTMRGALSTYVFHGGTQGGSSITQQYVKNVLVQKCEVYNLTADTPAKQKELDEKYQGCYDAATDDTPSRKLKEMRLAIGVAKRYSKDQILQSYLNITGFGGRVYGVQAAAEYYFGVSAKDVNLQQAATLVAIVNNPNYLRIDDHSISPTATSLVNTSANHFAAALQRRNYVLSQMLKEKKITAAQYTAAVATPIEPHITTVQTGCMAANQYSAGNFCDYVERTILGNPVFGKTADDRTRLFNQGGLKIYTTLNLDLQATAQAAVSAYVPAERAGIDLGGTNVSVEVGTGRIVTMAQNRPFDNTESPAAGTTSVNYNTDFDMGGSQGFQTGSSYKIFSLIEWLKEGHSLNDVIDASHHTFPQSSFHESPPCADIGGAPWQVKNDDGNATSMNVLNATAESVNTAFAMMATKLDLCGIKEDAQDLLVHGADEAVNKYRANPSAVLGTNYIAPITMATAYAGIANNGVACSPIAIDKITTASGASIPAPTTQCSQTPIDPAVAAGVIYALYGPIQHGTAVIANPHDGVPIFGKTGTTDNSYDNWFVSSTTKVAQATWVGNVQASRRANGTYSKTAVRSLTLGGAYGGDAKLHIAHTVIVALNKAYGGGQFPTPSAASLHSAGPSTPKPTIQPTP